MKSVSIQGNVFVSLYVFVFLFLPFTTLASVSITEVMYDAEGADTKHEWIEVVNEGAPFDLSEWKLFEGGTNHKLTIFSGSPTVPTGAYAVIADDAVTFLADYPGFSGILFDTAFTSGLSNSGETFVFRDIALVDKHTFTYDPTIGAGGDGNSLQKVGSSWQAGSPTPGASSGSTPPPPPPAENNTTPPPSTTTQTQSQPQSAPVVPQIRALAGDDRRVIAGASTIYSGTAVGLKGEPLQNARYLWSFGNGDSREGQSVLYAFPFPGKYAVTLDVSSEAWSATDRITVVAVTADIAIVSANGEYIEVENRSKEEIDIGLWQLSATGKTFIFPAHTILFPETKVRISTPATGLVVTRPEDVSLLYPNGVSVAGYKASLFVSSEPLSNRTSPVARQTSAIIVEEVVEEPVSEEGEILGAYAESSDPVPYFVWFLGLAGLIGVGWGAVYFIRKRYAQG